MLKAAKASTERTYYIYGNDALNRKSGRLVLTVMKYDQYRAVKS